MTNPSRLDCFDQVQIISCNALCTPRLSKRSFPCVPALQFAKAFAKSPKTLQPEGFRMYSMQNDLGPVAWLFLAGLLDAIPMAQMQVADVHKF